MIGCCAAAVIGAFRLTECRPSAVYDDDFKLNRESHINHAWWHMLSICTILDLQDDGTAAQTSSPLVNLSLTTLAGSITVLGWKTRWESWVLRPSSQWNISIQTQFKSLKTWPSLKQASLVRLTNCLTTGTEQEQWFTDHISSLTGNIFFVCTIYIMQIFRKKVFKHHFRLSNFITSQKRLCGTGMTQWWERSAPSNVVWAWSRPGTICVLS